MLDKELSVTGWNWGTAEFTGSDLTPSARQGRVVFRRVKVLRAHGFFRKAAVKEMMLREGR